MSQTLTYDLETDSVFPAYANITVCGFMWGDGESEKDFEIFEYPISQEAHAYIVSVLQDPKIEKIGFNNSNYDDIVLHRHGIFVSETLRQDGYLALKTVYPAFPSYSLKFANWFLFGDAHIPEYNYECYQKSKGFTKFGSTEGMSDKGRELLRLYNQHDLRQHKRLFEFLRPKIESRKHAEAYALDMAMGLPLRQMTLEGGLFINTQLAEATCRLLRKTKNKLSREIYVETNGAVRNLNSSKQLGEFFDSEGFLLQLTDKGEFQVDKETIKELQSLSPAARLVAKVRRIDSVLKYGENYLDALNDPTFPASAENHWIPTAFNISKARTRRFTSNSKHGLNFQNPNQLAKRLQRVPEGWLGWAFDATQVENVVHIHMSEDADRRHAYESDVNYNEYVWLCQRITGTKMSKKELDAIPSPVMRNWSIYKQYKTIKLALNFGMGAKKFASKAGVEIKEATRLFNDIHQACPAMHYLQEKVKKLLNRSGHVFDVFGHMYSGEARNAYKIVAYAIQGCGTGSLPKAQIRANFDTIQLLNTRFDETVAVLNCTTHDENSGFIRSDIGEIEIQNFLQSIMENMTTRFSHKFDGIPLRAKPYLYSKSPAFRTEISDLTKPINIHLITA